MCMYLVHLILYSVMYMLSSIEVTSEQWPCVGLFETTFKDTTHSLRVGISLGQISLRTDFQVIGQHYITSTDGIE